MKIVQTEIPGLVVLESPAFKDNRGQFFEVFKETSFAGLGIPKVFVQDNVSTSHKGVIRGLHFQVDPMAQGKLIRCLRGSVFDVAVDLRKDSKTYGRWHGVELKDPGVGFYVPAGFAHGFQALEDESLIYYKCTSLYSPTHEQGIRFDDPAIGIKWPLKASIVSEKDLKLPLLKDLS